MKLIKSPPFTLNNKHTQREKLGIRYEKKVHQVLNERFELRYFPQIWFCYKAGEKLRYCQTDGLLVDIDKKKITIIEVKYSHTSDAFWQMENVYYPVVKRLFGDSWQVCTVEVVKWYDPAVSCPRKAVLRERLEDVKFGEFAVHILNRID